MRRKPCGSARRSARWTTRWSGARCTASPLFEGGGSHPLASLGRASVTFDRGDFNAAADLAERHLRRLPATNRIERAAALELMARAILTVGAK